MAGENIKSKQLVLLGIGAAVLIVVIIFGSAKLMGGAKAESPSSVAVTPSSGSPEKTPEVTPAYRLEIERHNTEKRREAEIAGRTSLPVLLPVAVDAQEKPKTRTPDQPGPAAATPTQATPAAGPAIDPDLYRARQESMRIQIAGLLQRPLPTRTLVVSNHRDEPAGNAAGLPRTDASTNAPRENPGSAAVTPIAYAGDTLFALLKATIDTDEPDLVRFEIPAGQPMAGATLTGTATRQNELVKVVVNTMFYNKVTYDLTAQAVDIDTGRGLLAGEVDRKLIQRYGLPFLGGFVTGLGAALAQGGTTVNSTGTTMSVATTPLRNRQVMGAAFGAGANGVNQQIQRAASNAEIAVHVPSDIPVAIFLLSDVVPKSGSDSRAATSWAAAPQPKSGERQSALSSVLGQHPLSGQMPGQMPALPRPSNIFGGQRSSPGIYGY